MSADATCRVITTEQRWERHQSTPEDFAAKLVTQGWVPQGKIGDRIVLTHPDLTGVHKVVEP